MSSIQITTLETTSGWKAIVTVHGETDTQHTVHINKEYYDKLSAGRPIETFVYDSFAFLLQREPNTSIMNEFNIEVIQTYFSEYESVI